MREVITKWEDCPREDLSNIPKLIVLGWLPVFSYQDKKYNRTTFDNVPHDGVTFQKGDQWLRKGYHGLSQNIFQYWINTKRSYLTIEDAINEVNEIDTDNYFKIR